MNAALSTSTILTPSPRCMRAEGQQFDQITPTKIRPLNPGETSLDFTPQILPQYTFPFGNSVAVRSGNHVAILREGYESTPLGRGTTDYRLVDHRQTAEDVSYATMTRAEYEGALIDGHGYHTVHTFRLLSDVSEMVNDMPLISRLQLIHDYTGCGALRASVVTYLGDEIVLGSRNFTRRIHVGVGDKDVGVGSQARWTGTVIEAMLETAVLQQGSIAALLRAASTAKMTEDFAKLFEKRGIAVERTKVTKEEEARGEKPQIVPVTALDVVVSHHKQRRGNLTWGVWSRRLEGDALTALENITGVELHKQLFPRGA